MSRHIHLGDLRRKCKIIEKLVKELQLLVDDILDDLTFEDDNQNNNS